MIFQETKISDFKGKIHVDSCYAWSANSSCMLIAVRGVERWLWLPSWSTRHETIPSEMQPVVSTPDGIELSRAMIHRMWFITRQFGRNVVVRNATRVSDSLEVNGKCFGKNLIWAINTHHPSPFWGARQV